MRKPYEYGDPISPEEYVAVRDRLLPDRSREYPADDVLRALNEIMPMRLQHEVERLRGRALDAVWCATSGAFLVETA